MKATFTSFPSSPTFDIDYCNYWYFQDLSCSPACWYRLELFPWEEFASDKEIKEIGAKYHCAVRRVDISMLSFEDIEGALSFTGSLDNDASEISINEIVYAVFEYGSAEIELQIDGNNAHKLLSQGRKFIRNSLG